jgi:hypothetical protein
MTQTGAGITIHLWGAEAFVCEAFLAPLAADPKLQVSCLKDRASARGATDPKLQIASWRCAKNLTIEKGALPLFDEIRYFFYITNDWTLTPAQVVREATQRCNQENLIEQSNN